MGAAAVGEVGDGGRHSDSSRLDARGAAAVPEWLSCLSCKLVEEEIKSTSVSGVPLTKDCSVHFHQVKLPAASHWSEDADRPSSDGKATDGAQSAAAGRVAGVL